MKIAVAGATGMVGRHVMKSAERQGHATVGLSRSHGIDLTTGSQLATALEGVDTIIDVTNASSIEEQEAAQFFTAVTGNLHEAGAKQGVRHLVTLSIVGVDRIDFGYYRAKLVHEQRAAAGSVPSTILRATQFHELPIQLLMMTRRGDQGFAFDVTAQTIAASAVAEALVEAAEQQTQGRAADVAGPEKANLVELARAFVAQYDLGIKVAPDTASMSGVAEGALLPGSDARLLGPTYADWLLGADAAALRDALAS